MLRTEGGGLLLIFVSACTPCVRLTSSRERLRVTVYNPRLVLDDHFLAIRDVPLARSSFDEIRRLSEPHAFWVPQLGVLLPCARPRTAFGVLATIGAESSQNAGELHVTRINTGVQSDWKLCVAPMMEWTDRHCRHFHRLLVAARAPVHGNDQHRRAAARTTGTSADVFGGATSGGAAIGRRGSAGARRLRAHTAPTPASMKSISTSGVRRIAFSTRASARA